MESRSTKKGNVMFFVVSNYGMGDKILREVKEMGISEGIVFLGRGTAKSHVLKLLGLDEVKKEIVLFNSKSCMEDKIHEVLTEKFQIDKPNRGIAFSLPIKEMLDPQNHGYGSVSKGGDKDDMKYEVIFVIIDRGLAEEAINAAVSAGARGGTIIHGREADPDENNSFFSMHIEPEKEIVMILIDESKTDHVMESIKKAIEIDNKSKCTMFAMDVNRTSGISNDNHLI